MTRMLVSFSDVTFVTKIVDEEQMEILAVEGNCLAKELEVDGEKAN